MIKSKLQFSHTWESGKENLQNLYEGFAVFLFIKINGLLQELIDAGVIGEVIHIQHLEPVSRQIR